MIASVALQTTARSNPLAVVIRSAHMDDLEPMLGLQAEAFADKFRAAFGRRAAQRGLAAMLSVHRLQGPYSLQGMYVALHADRLVGTITMRTVEMRADDGMQVEQAFLRELGTWGTLRAMHAFSRLEHYIGRHEAYITDVAVDPAFRRRGVARTMMLHIAQAAREKHKHTLGLYVSASNTGARTLYHSLGFRDFSVRRSWWNGWLLGERRWVYMTCPLI